MTSPHHLPLHLLFVCSRNQWRSPTAESMYARVPELRVRSRGLSSSARRKLKAPDLSWADLIFVMEDAHAQRLRASFRDQVVDAHVYTLDIPDLYRRNDPELVDCLRAAIDPVLNAVLAPLKSS